MGRSEDLSDTMQSVGCYCDTIVVRHRSTEELLKVTEHLSSPVINGGTGIDEHPTQAIIDLYAIFSYRGNLKDLRIGVIGRLSESRAALSLLRILNHYSPKLVRVISPTRFQPTPEQIKGIFYPIDFHTSMSLKELNIIYIAGFPPGRRSNSTPANERRQFRLSLQHLKDLENDAIVLSPLPRVDEISKRFDTSRHAFYFEQSQLGLFARMAILDYVNVGLHRSTL
jgi:aspartate carbamoyltransferase catalytic subunit